MNNDVIIKNDYNSTLDEIVKVHGIEAIREYVKDYNKKSRKKQKKGNTYLEVAKDVYQLMMNQDYDKTRAIEQIAIIRNSSSNTVRNNCAKFDKIAKEYDYVSFSTFFHKILANNPYNQQFGHNPNYHDNIILQKVAKLNKLDNEIAEIYIYKYSNLTYDKKEATNIYKFSTPPHLINANDDIPF
jgi:hypothetical protein